MIVTIETRRAHHRITTGHTKNETSPLPMTAKRDQLWERDVWTEDTQAERIKSCYLRLFRWTLEIVSRRNRGPKGWTLKS